MNRFLKRVKGFAIGASVLVAALGWSEVGYALGTAVSTSLASTATVNYDVGATAQTAITAASGAFVVDRKVNMTLTKTDISVIPSTNNQVSTFVLTNTGNASQGYSLTTDVTNTDGVISAYTIYVDDGDNVYDAGDTAYAGSAGSTTDYTSTSSIGDLAADAAIRIHILVNVPNAATAANGETATIALKATALQTGSTINVAGTIQASDAGNPNVAGTVETVFADAGVGADATDLATDGEISVLLTYTVASAGLVGNITKTITVVDETSAGPTCLTAVVVPNAKAVPGACVEVTVTVNNGSGSVDALNVVVVDPVSTDLTVAGEVAATSDCDAYDYNTTNAGSVTCDLDTIDDTDSEVLIYRANID